VKRAALAAAFLILASLTSQARERRGAPAGDFDLYVLALSWSPGFCNSGGERREPEQCRTGARLGFVLHGLWPQYERGYPSFCEPQGRAPQRADLDAAAGLMPSRDLARYEWRKHGTCSGLAPSQYFSAAARAQSALAIPPRFGENDETATVLDVERAFAEANPGLRPDMMAIDCGKDDDGRSVLDEVRFCMSRDLKRFLPCPAEVERGGCRARFLAIPAMR
jgi:ribonuclease T2